jgi:tetratricopeptide (TPR) repeat protein
VKNVRAWSLSASLALLCVATAPPARAQTPAAPAAQPAASPVAALFERVQAGAADAKVLDAGLVEIDAVIAKNAKDPDAHYVRGWILSRLGKGDEAIASYDRAFALDKKLASALYNAGVVHAGEGRTKEALAYFDRALKVDPKLVDAAYNAGQVAYNDKDFAKAARFWQVAAKLRPDDFETAKKLVQTYVALDKPRELKKARDKLFEIKKASKEPRIAAMKAYVFDQLDVGRFHIYVYESFDPSGDLAYVYRFDVSIHDRLLGSINLETSAVIREMGTPFILGMDQNNKHTTFPEHAWKTLPPYKEVRALAVKLIGEKFKAP